VSFQHAGTNRGASAATLRAFLAATSLAALLISGCSPTPEKSHGTASATTIVPAGEQTQYRNELLRSAVGLLNSPEQFDDEAEDAAQLVERLNQWRRLAHGTSTAASNGDSTISSKTDSESDSAASTNSKSAGEKAPASEQLDPLLATLPENLLKLRIVRHLYDDVFDPSYDGVFLCEAALLRDVANHIEPEKLDDVSVAQALFDWTVRNIQIDPQPAADATPEEYWLARHLPGEAVYFGAATPLGRSWVFMLLARQRGLDVVLLATPDPSNPEQFRPWATALLTGGELYLFDPTYGLPIPGPGGKGVATLAEAAADDAILRQMDIPGDRIYPRKAADLQKVTALLEASPGYHAPRMKMLQSHLTGQDRLVLTASPAELAEKLRAVKHIDQIKLWPQPYEVLQERRTLSPQLQQAANLERVPFTIPADPEQAKKQQTSDEPHRRERTVLPLRLGRLLQLRGLFGSSDRDRPAQPGQELSEVMENGAKYYYLRAIPTQDQSDEIARLVRNHVEIAPGRSLSPEFLNAFQRRRDDAAYWLGIVAFEQGDLSTAAQFFGPMTLDAFPDGPWTNGARYNLARCYEAQGKLPEAIKLYEADRSPQRYGNRLRAFRLKENSAAKNDSNSKSPAMPGKSG